MNEKDYPGTRADNGGGLAKAMSKKPFWQKKGNKNVWKCPECGKEVDYGDGYPSAGRTYCDLTGKNVQMEQVRSKNARTS